MDWLQSLLDNSTVPALTALFLGFITAISPCPLATNIAAIGFISKDISNRKSIFHRGLLYGLGRVVAYSVLGIVLIELMRQSVDIFGVRRVVTNVGEAVVGPLLVLIGVFMLIGHKLRLPKVSIGNRGEGLARRGMGGAFALGCVFAMAFCPASGVLYFGMLIPMSATTTMGWLLPPIFAVATAVPVMAVAWILAFSVEKLGTFYGRMKALQRIMNVVVGALFFLIGIYYCIIIYIL
ncbi:MAG: aromatic aminobenezylarsenical efflux permease ArsG family transporter [Muribaculaceae bacterium]